MLPLTCGLIATPIRTRTQTQGSPCPGRLDEYLGYYEARSRSNQRWYRHLNIAQLVAAALIPVVASLNASGLSAFTETTG
jgi:Protein of unknown function (DUF4231)